MMPLHANPRRGEEFQREVYADQDEHPIDFDDHLTGGRLDRRGPVRDVLDLCAAQHAKPGTLGLGKQLLIRGLGAIEIGTTMAERDACLRLLGEREGGLDGHIATADDEDPLANVIRRIGDMM